MQIKMESDLDYDSVKIFGEKMDSLTRAKLGMEDAAELAYTTAEHHPYWGVLYNCTEITKTILEKWHDEITSEQLAHDAGIDVVFNRCMLAEHRRLT